MDTKWRVSAGDEQTVFDGQNRKLVSVACGGMTGRTLNDAESAANLIAAAPNMFEALEGIEHFSDALNYRDDTLSVELRKWIDVGRAALAKARGEHG